MSYLVHLHKFEGPLGLLLYLIRKEEMDIFDININQITSQSLDYIRMMKELDLEVAGEFVAMAATLLHIKSRMLLPSYNEEGEEVEQEDPRKELVQKLLEYQRYQEAGRQLYQRPLLSRDVWVRGIREDFNADQWGEIIIEEDGLFSLISSYRKAIRRMKQAVHQVHDKMQSIAGRIMEIKDRLIVGQRVIMRDLIQTGPHTRVHLLITFLSILELGRMGFVNLFQNETYGDIHIETTRPIERNVLERVQEFDSIGAEDVVKSMISEATSDAHIPDIQLAEEFVAIDEPVLESAQLSLLEQPGDDGLVAEAFATDEIASDDEILAAEQELALLTLEESPVVSAPETHQSEDLSFAADAPSNETDPGSSEPEASV